jgi:hypothetical protein
MYSQKAWGGPVEPHIEIDFVKNTAEDDTDPTMSLIIFEWKDYDLVGLLPTPDSVQVVPTSSSSHMKFSNVHTRKSTYAIQRQSTMDGVIALRPENSYWQKMLPPSQRT